jgi:demethoxyubiquinone hydroxylase (CLK1/Coq7/Cat5 family)
MPLLIGKHKANVSETYTVIHSACEHEHVHLEKTFQNVLSTLLYPNVYSTVWYNGAFRSGHTLYTWIVSHF